MKILVTGGLGFIGSNIVERLVTDGHEVTVLDNIHTGDEANVKAVKDRIKVVKANSGDIAKFDEKFDIILHQGIYSSSPMYKENKHLTATVLDEMISILEYAKKNGTKIVFASSSSVYNQNEPPHREDMTIRITDYYTEGRYAMERVAQLYNELYSVRVIGLRYFSVYGPHEKFKGKYANLITQFLWNMKKGEKVVIFGDGKQTRDFIHVSDVVEANLAAMDSDINFGMLNVGTGTSIEIKEMVKLLGKKLGKEPEVGYIENKIKNYVAHTQADTSLSKEKLRFAAKVPLEKGMEMLVDYYEKNPPEIP
jgi:UDP-glucose 4-epimerase